MLTARLHLGYLLTLSGALPLIPLYAFVILTLGFHLCLIGRLWMFHWTNELHKISLSFFFVGKIIFSRHSGGLT